MTRKFHCVAFLVFFVVVTQIPASKPGLGEENPYKHSKQMERFKKSSFFRFQTGLHHTIDELEEKSDNLEAMNQNLEGRVNMLASEKEKLSKAHAHLRVKQSALEKEQARLKKKAASLEVAYKKLSSRTSVAKAPKKTKPVAQKKSGTKTTQKKTSATKKSTVKTAKATKAGKKVTRSEKTETRNEKTATASSLSPYQQRVTEIKKPEEGVPFDGVDIKKINEKGIEYGRKGMYDAAIIEFQRVASVEPNLANVHYNLGLAYKKKGLHAEAEKEFAEYERLKGQNN